MKYKEYSFKELLSNIVDNRGRTCPTAEEGIPLIATNCIRNEQLYPSYEKIRYISQDTYDTWFRDHPKPDDMIFVCKGSPGRVCWVPNPINFCIAQDMVAIRADETKVYPKYLFALLRSSETQHHIENMHVGTLIPHFKKGDFGNLFLRIPEDYEYQRKVGDMYFQLCNKIELNRQINQTLEAIAQAIFKSWFVDFEPVRAKIAAIEAGEDAEGVTYAAMSAISGKTDEELDQLQAEQPEHYKQLKTTAELFPDAIQDSELGEIPFGWMVRTLGSLLTELRRGISPKYIDEGGVIVINQKCIRNHSINFTLAKRNDTKLQKVEGREIQVGDVLVNSTGVGTLGRLATIRYLPESAVVDSHITVVRASDEIGPLFLNEYMLTKESFIEASGAGSTGQTELRRQVLEELFIVVPNHTLIDNFEIMSKPISSSIAEREQECQLLTQIRDALLPKLLSGELSVEAIELAAE